MALEAAPIAASGRKVLKTTITATSPINVFVAVTVTLHADRERKSCRRRNRTLRRVDEKELLGAHAAWSCRNER